MNLEKGKITDTELMILMIGFFLSTPLVVPIGAAAGRDAWLASLLGTIEGAILCIPTLLLAARFRNQTLVQIHDAVYGKIFGKLASLIFLWFPFHLASIVFRTFIDFFRITTMPNTPETVFTVMFMIICVYALKSGLEPLTRTNQILVIMTVGIFILVNLVLLKNTNWINLLPILETPLPKLMWSAHNVAVLPIAEIVVFLMIFPYVPKHQKIIRPTMIAILISGLIFAVLAIRVTGVLGGAARIFIYPSYQTARLINIAHILTRLEILTVISVFLTGFLKVVTLLYCVVLGSAQMLKFSSYQPLILPIGILLIILAQINFIDVNGPAFFAQYGFPIYALLFEVFIPLITLVVAVIRKLPQKEST